MHWLVTFAKSVTPEERNKILTDMACQVDDEAEPVEIDDDVVIEVEGPSDLPKRGRSIAAVKAVHPSSEYTLYSTN